MQHLASALMFSKWTFHSGPCITGPLYNISKVEVAFDGLNRSRVAAVWWTRRGSACPSRWTTAASSPTTSRASPPPWGMTMTMPSYHCRAIMYGRQLAGLDDCLNMVLSCFRKKMSETGLISIEFETISADEYLFPSVSICLYPNIGQLWENYDYTEILVRET